jgi:hypothetical protein
VTLQIQFPATREAEHAYIIDVLVGELLGLEYRALPANRATVGITLAGDSTGTELVIESPFLQIPDNTWLGASSLPTLPLPELSLDDVPFQVASHRSSLPVLYGARSGNAWWSGSPTGMHLGVDIFGSAFFMLTRYEEIAVVTRDDHDRFPARASLAARAGILDRPIVNEYLEVLWGAIHHLWPQLERRRRQYRAFVSHDVDWPLVTLGVPVRQVARSAVGDVLTRKDPALAMRRLLSRYRIARHNFDGDVGNTFDFIMDTSEARGITSAFYFITDHTAGTRDGTYSIEHSWVRALMRRLHDRGHEIGLHPSYNSFRDPSQTRIEFDRLRQVCDEEGIRQTTWGGRQHYLRWSNPETWQNWDQAGLDYDSTLSFADRVGFRSGVCFEYPVFDLRARIRLKVRERPLLVMEATLFKTASPNYMAQSDEDGLATLDALRSAVGHYSGDFALLWHNSSLISAHQKALYQRVVARV